MQTTNDRIIFGQADFLAGLTPRQIYGAGKVRTGNRGLQDMRDFDPFSTIPGMAFPGKLPVNITGVSGSVPSAVLTDATVQSQGVYSYLIGGDKVHRMDITTNTLSTSGGWPHTIPDAGHAGHTSIDTSVGSVAIYNVSGVARLFYSWGDNTDWDVGMYDLTSAFNDDFMSTTPTSPLTGTDLTDGQGKLHPLYVGGDDLLYIGSGRHVHVYDGLTNTFSSQVFILPLGYEVVGFAETGDSLVVFASTARNGRRSIARAFFYGADRGADPYKIVFLEDDTVACPFFWNGTIGCFTNNRNSGRNVLRLFDGSRFVPKFYWSGSALPSIGGMETKDNLILWNSSGIIYGWGSVDGVYPAGGFQLCRTAVNSLSGFLKSFITGDLHSSGGVGSLSKFDFSTKSFDETAEIVSLTAFPNFPKGKKGKLTEVKITFADVASGGRELTMQIMVDSGQTAKTILASTPTITASTLTRRYFTDTSGNALPIFDNLKMYLSWTAGTGATDAPGVEKIEVFYETIDI